MKRYLIAALFWMLASPAMAGVSCTLPFNLTNGTTADATQVMANYNALVSCLTNAAAAGSNSDITALLGLTTPLALNEGGTPVYIGGTSGGSANAQTITTSPPFIASAGNVMRFKAGASNTGSLTVNGFNVFRRSQLGATMSVGGEIYAGEMVDLEYDGTEFQCLSCGRVKVGGFTYLSSPNTSPDAGELFADGSCVSQTTYADLFSVIGTNYSVGISCNAGNFRLPDARGNNLVALDNQGVNGNAGRLGVACTVSDTTIGDLCGAQNQTLAQANLGASWSFPNSGITLGNNSGSEPMLSSGTGSPGQNSVQGVNNSGNVTFNSITVNTVISAQGSASSNGSGTPVTTVPPLQFVRVTVHY